MVSRALRTMVGSPTRKPIEQIFFRQRHGEQLPPAVLGDMRLSRIFEATRRAPSWKNVQPWFFILTGKEVLVYKKKSRDREGKDYHLVDCGIAMAHLHLAARQMGFSGQWKLGKFEVPGEPDAEPIGRYPLEIAGV
jgi:nitroreductase